MGNFYREDEMISGAFIRCWKLIKRETTIEESHKFIKITEIKLIYGYGDYSIFHTYKDAKYLTYLSEKDLITAVNKLIFKPDDFYFDYMENC